MYRFIGLGLLTLVASIAPAKEPAEPTKLEALRQIVAHRHAELSRGRKLAKHGIISSGEMADLTETLIHAKIDLARAGGDEMAVDKLQDELMQLGEKQFQHAKKLREMGGFSAFEFQSAELKFRQTQARYFAYRGQKTEAVAAIDSAIWIAKDRVNFWKKLVTDGFATGQDLIEAEVRLAQLQVLKAELIEMADGK